mgnify:CR=1 FL=1|tara:strand:- start:266 stop:457 length:192 start_codon:yes stop_codon:yes gene_type:complete
MMGIKNSKSDEAKENIFVKYYCDNLLHQNVNIKQYKNAIKSFTNVYNFRKQSFKKHQKNHNIK